MRFYLTLRKQVNTFQYEFIIQRICKDFHLNHAIKYANALVKLVVAYEYE